MQTSFLAFYVAVLGGLALSDRLGVLHRSGVSMLARLPVLDASAINNSSLNGVGDGGRWLHAEQSSVDLVMFAVVMLTPTMAAWRAFWKHVVFTKLASACVLLEEQPKVHAKFVEQAWLAFHFSAMLLLELYVLQDKPWWPPLVAGEGIRATLQERLADQQDAGLRAMYAIQLAFYSLELITLTVVKENRQRSDAGMYLFHHIYTVLLLAGSWLLLCHRFGSLILIIHDVGDVFLPIGKCFSYSERKVKRTCSPRALAIVQNVGTGVFAVFVAMFIIPRVLVLGGIIYHTGYELGWTVCCGNFVRETLACTALCPSIFYMKGLMALLVLLWPMQMFWMLLIFKMAFKILTGVYQDVRSDDDEGEEATSTTAQSDKKDVSPSPHTVLYQRRQQSACAKTT